MIKYLSVKKKNTHSLVTPIKKKTLTPIPGNFQSGRIKRLFERN